MVTMSRQTRDSIGGKLAKPPLVLVAIHYSNAGYPAVLKALLGKRAPESIQTIGNQEILCEKKLALFCSIKCPGEIILKTYDLARHLRDTGVTVISGFHSPMEKECLRILLRGEELGDAVALLHNFYRVMCALVRKGVDRLKPSSINRRTRCHNRKKEIGTATVFRPVLI